MLPTFYCLIRKLNHLNSKENLLTYGIGTVGVVKSVRRISVVGALNVFVLKIILEVTDTPTDLTLVTL